MKCRHGHEAGVSAEPDCAPCVIYAMSEEVDGLKAKLAAGEEWAEKARAQIASDQLDLARLTREVETLKRERDEVRATLDVIRRHDPEAHRRGLALSTPTPCPECWGSKRRYRTDNDGQRHMYPCPSCAKKGGQR